MLSRPAAENVIYVAVLHRHGGSYVLDVYPGELEALVADEKKRRAFFVKSYATREAARQGLSEATRRWNLSTPRRWRHRR
jgi:hypothetical protein